MGLFVSRVQRFAYGVHICYNNGCMHSTWFQVFSGSDDCNAHFSYQGIQGFAAATAIYCTTLPRLRFITVKPLKLETGLRPSGAGIPYILL